MAPEAGPPRDAYRIGSGEGRCDNSVMAVTERIVTLWERQQSRRGFGLLTGGLAFVPHTVAVTKDGIRWVRN